MPRTRPFFPRARAALWLGLAAWLCTPCPTHAGEADGLSRWRLNVSVGPVYLDDDGATPFDGGGHDRLAEALSPDRAYYERLLERLGGEFLLGEAAPAPRFDTPIAFGLSAGYRPAPGWELRAGLGFAQAQASLKFPVLVFGSSTGPVTRTGTIETDVSLLRVSVDARRAIATGPVAPYFGAGVRYEHVSPGETRGQLAGITFPLPDRASHGDVIPHLVAGLRVPISGRAAIEIEAQGGLRSVDRPEGDSRTVFEPELRGGLTVALPGSGATTPRPPAGGAVSEADKPPSEEEPPKPPAEEEPTPPAEKDGPCDWVHKRFQFLIDAFPMPNLDLFCRAAEACLDAERKSQAAAAAQARLDKARADLDRAQRLARSFADYLGTDAAKQNQAGDADLQNHYRKVTADNQKKVADGQAAVAAAERAATATKAEADAARKKCDEARALAEAEIERIRKLLDAWKEFRADLARCETCASIEVLDKRVGDILKRIRDAKKACEEKLLGPERAALAKAEADYQAASDKAAADAAAHDAAAAGCRDLAGQVQADYQGCFDRALEGIDHAMGDRPRGYPSSKTVRTGTDNGDLGPVHFKSSRDRTRFSRALDDCLRAKVNGRTTKPNALTRRSELRRCQGGVARAFRKAQKSQRAADAAEAALRAARARMGDAANAFGPFDDLEAAAAAWSAFAVEVGADCTLRKKDCDEIRDKGEAGVPPLPEGCDPADFRDRAEAAAAKADAASDVMDGLAMTGCGGGRAAVERAGNDANAVLGDDGALEALEKALADRDAALARARAHMGEGRCEEAAAEYAKARDAAVRAAEACALLKRLVPRAEASADAAEQAAADCKAEDEGARQRERERRDREERERREATAAAQAAREAAQAAARERREADARAAAECFVSFVEWLRAEMGDDEADEVLATIAGLAQTTAEAAGAAIADAAAAAAKGAPTAGITAAGISTGIFQLGVGLFYTWMQWEIQDALGKLDKMIDLGRAQIHLMNARGRCGTFTEGSSSYFWLRTGNTFRVFRVSETAGLFGGKTFTYLGEIATR